MKRKSMSHRDQGLDLEPGMVEMDPLFGYEWYFHEYCICRHQ
jgi:hypothetical protein